MEWLTEIENQVVLAAAALTAGVVIARMCFRCIARVIRFLVNAEKFMHTIMYEIRPNAGLSLRDAIDRIDTRTKLIEKHLGFEETDRT